MEKKFSYNFFVSRGVTADFADTFSKYAQALENKKLPVIFDFEHLALLLGIKPFFLAKMVFGGSSFYREFHLKKRSGGYRVIKVPHESLKYIQKWILINILNNLFVHPCAHGFVKNKSIKTNAILHLGCDALLKIDLKDFFPSIKKEWVINLFRDLGYSSEVSFFLASLVCCEGCLVQGAPTSPAISNVLFYRVDERINRLCKKHEVNYTRYADDMSFSGKYISLNFREHIQIILQDAGFTLNELKTRLKINAGSRIVTGLVVSEDTLKIPRNYKREIKKELFFITKYGYLSHMERNEIKNHNYLYQLLGRVSFWRDIEPMNIEVNKYYSLLKELIK